MKPFEEIYRDKRLYKRKIGRDGGQGYLMLAEQNISRAASVIWSNGGGWDHVSVSYPNRCPTWDEMCMVKDIFFLPEETCVEYHPAKENYVNIHPYCLHIWRPQKAGLPLPTKLFV